MYKLNLNWRPPFCAPDADDYCSFQMKCENDVHANVLLNTHCAGAYEQEIVLIGTAGVFCAPGRAGPGRAALIGGKSTDEAVVCIDVGRFKNFFPFSRV
jgi:hypothetical protein